MNVYSAPTQLSSFARVARAQRDRTSRFGSSYLVHGWILKLAHLHKAMQKLTSKYLTFLYKNLKTHGKLLILRVHTQHPGTKQHQIICCDRRRVQAPNELATLPFLLAAISHRPTINPPNG